MKKKLFLIILLLGSNMFPQTLIESFSFPQYNYYNYLWGITERDGYFWIGSDYTPTTSAPAKLYKISKTGIIVDSIFTPLNSNHGVEWDGLDYWLAEGYRASGCRIYHVTPTGIIIDSFQTQPVGGNPVVGIGDITREGTKIWYSVFSPDFVSYPQGYAFAFDMSSKEITDTIPLRGRQVLGIASKGDTIFYVNENQYANESERIYAYSKITGDTIFSFPTPDPDGNCNPKGLYWDGEYLWLLAERIGGPNWVYKTLYKYAITGQGNPIISVSPTNINFGTVVVGVTSEININVMNIGNAPLTIFELTTDNPVFTAPLLSIPDIIPPGESRNYRIEFTPAVYDSVFGILTVHSDDGGTPDKNISLKGKGVFNGSYIYTPFDQYNFGGRRLNSLCGWDLEINNFGNQNLQINSTVFASQQFSVDTNGLSYPVTIAPESKKIFRIWFNPESIGSFSDSLIINSNSVNYPVRIIYLQGSAFENPAMLGDILWQMTVPFNPTAFTNDLQPTSMKKIGDVNDDGIDDIILTAKNYLTICVNGNSSLTGDVIWSFNTGYDQNNTGSVGFQDAMQVRTDVDGDGIEDVVIGCGGGNEFVYTISGRTGNLIWKYGDSLFTSNGDINGLRADKDFNGDGVNDVIVSASGSSTGGRHALICLNGLTGSEIFNLPQNCQYTFDVTTFQNGGAICIDQGNGGPYFINGFNNSGTNIWSVPVPEVVWNIKEINDINNDGTKDFVAYSGGINVNVYARSSLNGSLIWNNPYPNFSTFANIKIISDLDSNGYEDMIFSGKEGLYRLDTKTGATLWSNPLDFSYTFGVDEMIDFDNDGYNEIIAGTRNANLYILKGIDGSIYYQYTAGSPTANAVERVIDLMSIDGNYSHEFVAATKDGRIMCFSGGPVVPIPVELNSFTAKPSGYDVHLQWMTASETNNSGFEVDRREVGNSRLTVGNEEWDVIGFVDGRGTTTEQQSYSFVDENISSGSYQYRLKQIDFDGSYKYSSVVDAEVIGVTEFSLSQNYPNPFNPSTVIEFSIPEDASDVRLTIYDALGQRVKELINSKLDAGKHEYVWDASDVSGGVYIYELRTSKFNSVKKMLMIK